MPVVERMGGMFETIVHEMLCGNFSFLILVVGIVQIVLMLRK